MNRLLTYLILLIVATGCASSVRINKKAETSTNQIEITTVVHKYVIEDSRYYGSIETTNNTMDTLIFNFNQSIIVTGDTMVADYNIKPISYAMQAFYIYPNSTKTWDVAWNSKAPIEDHSKLTLITDTSIQTLSRKNIIQKN